MILLNQHQLQARIRIISMKKKAGLQAYFHSVEAPAGLCEAIMARIAYAQRRAAQLRTGLFGALALASGVALVPAFQYAAQQFYASGFYDYLSLLSTDSGFILTYWREFGLSLVESLPSLALLLLLPIACALAYSLYRLTQTGRVAFGRLHAQA